MPRVILESRLQQGYELRPTVPSDAPALNALYCKLTGIDRNEAAWRWEWRDGPSGPAPSWVIVQRGSGLVVGHHGVVPTPLALGARRLRAARTENTMVDPEHRSRFIYSAYEAQILRQLLEDFEIIFTTAGAGTPGAIRRRLGYAQVGTWNSFTPVVTAGWIAQRLTRNAHVARLASALDRGPPSGWRLEQTTDCERIAALWSRWRSSVHITPDRSAADLSWRLLHHPYAAYRIATVFNGADECGAVVWSEVRAATGALDLVVEDMFVRDEDENCYRNALLALAGGYRAARVLVRTLDLDTPLARALRHLAPAWTLKRGAGSAFLARFADPALAKIPWQPTMLLAEGYQAALA